MANTRRAMTTFGCLALGCYAVHAAFHLLHNHPEDLLWACHLGAAIVGIGLLISSSTLNGIGTLFLCLGTPLWLTELAGGGAFYPTSCFTHIGGLAIGLYSARRLGIPGGTWWKAIVALIALILICRLVTPPQSNINVAFAIYPGMEKYFSSHFSYLATMLSIAAGYFFIIEFVLRRWLAPEPIAEGAS